MAEAKAEHYQHIFTYKSEILDEVFEKVNGAIEQYTTKAEYKETLRTFIIEAAGTLEGGDLIIKLNKKDQSLLNQKDLIECTNAVKEQTGVETTLHIAEGFVNILGGTILTSADGTATVENSFETRLRKVRQENRGEIEAILFS